MMYQAYQTQNDLMWPLRTWAKTSSCGFLASPSAPPVGDLLPLAGLGSVARSSGQRLLAACKLLELAEVTHKRPPWYISSVEADGQTLAVTEEAVLTTPFATLLRFRKAA